MNLNSARIFTIGLTLSLSSCKPPAQAELKIRNEITENYKRFINSSGSDTYQKQIELLYLQSPNKLEINLLIDLISDKKLEHQRQGFTELLSKVIASREWDDVSDKALDVLISQARDLEQDKFQAFRAANALLNSLYFDLKEKRGSDVLLEIIDNYKSFLGSSKYTEFKRGTAVAPEQLIRQLDDEFLKFGYQDSSVAKIFTVNITKTENQLKQIEEIASKIKKQFVVHQEGKASLYDSGFAINCIGSTQVFLAHARTLGFTAYAVQLVEREDSNVLHMFSIVKLANESYLFVDLLKEKPVGNVFDISSYKLNSNSFYETNPQDRIKKFRILNDQEVTIFVNVHSGLSDFIVSSIDAPNLAPSIPLLEENSRLDPKNFNIIGSYAMNLLALELPRINTSRAKTEDLTRLFNEALSLAPNSPNLMAYYGALELNKRNPIKALELWNNALELALTNKGESQQKLLITELKSLISRLDKNSTYSVEVLRGNVHDYISSSVQNEFLN